MGGNGIRIVISGAYFIVLARLLGPSTFGLFSAILALSNLVSPFAYMGQTDLLIQHLSRHPDDLPVFWGQALVIAGVSGLSLTLVLTGPLTLWLPGSAAIAVGLLLLSEVFCIGLQSVQKGVLIAREHMATMATVDTGMAGGRLLIATVAWSLNWHDLLTWSVLYASMALSLTVVGYGVVIRQVRSWPLSTALIWQHRQACLAQARAGWDFAVGLAAIKTFTDLDKVLLPRLATATAGGIYSAAYRLINIAQAPVIALLTSGFAEVCRQGQHGPRSAYTYSLKLLPWVMGYGLAATLGLVLLSYGMPVVLGPDYVETATAVRWLSGIVGLEGTHLLFSNLLTGAGLQQVRGYAQLFALGLNAILNSWWIPLWGWQGAAGATLVAEVGLVGLLIGAMRHALRQQSLGNQ